MQPTATTTGALLRQWRKDAGLKLDRAAVYASDRMGQEISSEKVRRYETGYPEDEMEPLVLAGLLDLYGRSLSELPEEVRGRVRKARDLLSSMIGCIGGSDCHCESPFRCQDSLLVRSA